MGCKSFIAPNKPKEPAKDRKNNFTKTQYDAIKELLRREAEFGTERAAQMSGNTFNDANDSWLFPNFHADGLLEPFNSSVIGSINIDPVVRTELIVYTTGGPGMTPFTAGFEATVTRGQNGSLELDWFTDLNSISRSMALPVYAGGKTLWTGIKAARGVRGHFKTSHSGSLQNRPPRDRSRHSFWLRLIKA